MKLKKEFITYNTDGKQIMVSADTSVFSGLVRSNETAAYIIDCLKEETDEKTMIRKMLEEYDASEDIIARDVHKVIEALKGIGALDE